MRLQGLIPVIVSLRSSESERRWCGFTPRGGKHGRGRKPLTDGRSKALTDSAAWPEPATTNQVRARPAHQREAANGGGAGEDPSVTVVDPTWDHGAIAEKKRKSNSRKEKTHGVVTRSERRGTIFFFWPDRRGFVTAVCTWWTDGRSPLGRAERIWKLDLFDRRRSYGRYAQLRWRSWWFRIGSRTSRTHYPHLQLFLWHFYLRQKSSRWPLYQVGSSSD